MSPLVPWICAATVLAAAAATALFSWRTGPAYGRGRGIALFWALYGLILAGLCLASLNLGLFFLGLLVPLLSRNVWQLLTVGVLGPEVHRQQLVAVVKAGPGRLIAAAFVTAVLQASVGVALVLIAKEPPARWLGAGLIVSPLFGLLAAIRLVLRPPKGGPTPGPAGA
jgi:hypothetical protein